VGASLPVPPAGSAALLLLDAKATAAAAALRLGQPLTQAPLSLAMSREPLHAYAISAAVLAAAAAALPRQQQGAVPKPRVRPSSVAGRSGQPERSSFSRMFGRRRRRRRRR
tara:strand:- start:844 stop:1176 length:333 start_codon:yes stop_codon:yes gene_type:complete